MGNNKQQTKEIATLGDNRVFIKRTERGGIKAVAGYVRLSLAKNDVAYIKEKYMVTAFGYYKLNKIAGVSILTPDHLTLPTGETVANPFPIIDPKSGSITKVWVKKKAVGYSPTGNLVVVSSTLLYDIKMYFVQDLIKKMKKNKNMGKICTENKLSELERNAGIFLPVEYPIGIWANLQDENTRDCFETFIQNKLFAERKAQTICERNCLKKHPALFCQIDKSMIKNGGCDVFVIGWTSDLTSADYDRLANTDESEEQTYNGKEIKNINANEELTEEDMEASPDDEIPSDDKEASAISPETCSADNQKGNNQKEELINSVKEAQSILGVGNYSYNDLSNMNTEQLQSLLKKLNERIDLYAASSEEKDETLNNDQGKDEDEEVPF